MRVVVGSNVSTEFRQAELERHLEAMSRFVEQADKKDALCCTMILRSAASTPAQALIHMKDALLSAGVRARAILARLEPEDELKQFFSCLRELAPDEPAAELIRWARNPRLLDAHEQATYGDAMCWSGDAMRRDAGKRNPLVLFDMDAPDAAQLSTRAFSALWGASVPVPERHLVAGVPAKPSGAYEQTSGDAPTTALRRNLQGWPLVRH
ncbi:MAG: hypothetical protein KBT60_10885 [Methyloceanibacter sp.]|jgi:hypothetical protein|nr:hypothetical protein [Methyloceanibacter sp.]